MVKDPICGMTVDERKSIKLQKDNTTYYFCSEDCKKKFLDKNKASAPVAGEEK